MSSFPRNVAALLAGLTLSAPALAQTPSASIQVDASKTGPRVSPHLYGLFFEEINHSGDGGLYAELIENRSFEDDKNAPKGWTPISAKATVDAAKPLNAQNPLALRLEVDAPGGGIANDGHWGMAMRKGERYKLSLWARGDSATGPLTARIEGAAGAKLAEARVAPGVGAEWKRYEITLTPSASDPKSRLVLSAAKPGTLHLDTVSLFPQNTFKNRPNGLRPDLAEKLSALKPSFLRFPGGCYVEGDTMASAYRWKETIGPIETRPGRPNLWGYRSTDGLGYHEYLQMCEDLGAEPLLVVNCGMSHKGNVPLDQLDTWIQDTLDAIEYAKGPATSKWGALRAQHGHPKPFNLTFLEIGNENGGPAYDQRYARFYDAVRAKHPEIKIVANVWGGTPKSRPSDIIDEHYYNSPEWFLANANRYDSYPRTGPKIYVGEYAVTSGSGQGNLRGALAEAAFMMGMERNSDQVVMASYAPLFVNVSDRKWNPDLIGFDSAGSFGTPSYYVQQLFAQHRPEVTVATTVTGAKPVAKPAVPGTFGVGTWLTQAEYKDVRINGAPAPADWNRGGNGGDWQTVDGAYRQTAGGEDRRAVLKTTPLGDFTMTLKARKISGDEGFLILFRVQNDSNYYWWNLGGWGNTRHAVERSRGGSKSTVSNDVDGKIETGRWYDIKIEAEGSRIRCYLDGKLVHDFSETPTTTLFATAGSTADGELVLKVVNAGEDAQATSVALNGISGGIDPNATLTVLTDRDPMAENALHAPTKVAPTTRKIRLDGTTFTHSFPAHSLTILRVRTGKAVAAVTSRR